MKRKKRETIRQVAIEADLNAGRITKVVRKNGPAMAPDEFARFAKMTPKEQEAFAKSHGFTIKDGGEFPDDVLLSLYGTLAGLNNTPFTVVEQTRDEARGRYAQEIVRRRLLDPGCKCVVCEGIRLDAELMDFGNPEGDGDG